MQEEQEAQKLGDRFMQLPTEIQNLMLSEKMTETVESIARRYQLSPDKTEILLEEIGLVLLGNTQLKNFKEHLIIKIQLPQARITALAAEIDKEILSSVHHLLNPARTEEVLGPTTPTVPKETSLADQVAQFQARKKQKEEEQKKLIPMSAPETRINPSSPNSLQ